MGDETLEDMKNRISEEKHELEQRLVPVFIHIADTELAGGFPSARNRENGELIS